MDRARESLFTPEIDVLELPLKFKMPTWKIYAGKEDPLSHLKYFEMQMDLQGVLGDVRCRVFPATLTEFAQHEDLVEVKQRPGEPLRAYISKFMTEATKVARLTEEGRLTAILGGIEVLGELWKDIKRCGPMWSMVEFLDRADGFIKLEEARQRADIEPKPGQLPDVPSVGAPTQSPQYPSSLTPSEKRSNNNGKQDNEEKGKFTGKVEHTPRENASKFTAFSVLTDDLETIYATTQSMVPYKKPTPMKNDVSKRDTSKFCHFHADYDHDTNDCNNLKREIEFLIRKNNLHVQKYIKADHNQRAAEADNNQDLIMPSQVDGYLQVIIGGPHLAGDSGKAQERYARTLQHEQKEVVLAVEERKQKIPRVGEPTITFTEADDVHICFPHNDPLVVEVEIANKTVARTMIDNGASSNILFKTPYQKMGLQKI
ncbi:uncharacterized protein LOC115723582 [Cannabis sativa]|uniref:uncharacterized protein LOC115723582 n=1 Tax=Cannabis sativa TaxID=3483 RepID=UPI0011DF5FDC|nr:uncharacterized protein LOC115723582 [Cannabis sativa]